MKQERYCLNANLRKASRAIALLYSRALLDSELQGTQFTLLSCIAKVGEVTIGELGEFLVMDQTTVTRNVGLLKKMGYVEVMRQADRRKRAIRLTKKGENTLSKTRPMWLEAQTRLWEALGEEKAAQLLALTNEITALEKKL
jgi:MarR family transcriptional regulator, organic hydroperoxide resistance regulator